MPDNLRPLKPGDVHTAEVFRDIYGFTVDDLPPIKVDPEEVPENLRSLIPEVEKWAIRCDVRRGDFFDKQSEESIELFYRNVEPFIEAINVWLDEQDEDVLKWPEAAVDFMYFAKAHCDAYTPVK